MISRLSLQQRMFLLLGVLLTVSLIVIWTVVHPRYQASVVEERTTIIEQLQSYSITSLDQQIAAWTNTTRFIAWQILHQPKEGEALVQSITTLNPEIIRIRIHSERLSDELVSQNTAYPSITISVPNDQWIASKLDSTMKVSWVRSTDPDLEIFVTQKTFKLQNIDFQLTVTWDAKKLSVPLQRFPLGDNYYLGVHSLSATVFENKSPFKPTSGNGWSPSEHVQIIKQSANGWRVLTTEFQSVKLWMVVGVPEDVILQPVRRLVLFSTSAVITLSVILLLLGWMVTRQISKPIARLVEDVNRMSALDFSREIRIPPMREFQAMGTTVETMRQVLDRYQKMNVEKIILEEWKNKFFMTHSDDLIAIADDEGKFAFVNDRLREFIRDISPMQAIESKHDLLNLETVTTTKESKRTDEVQGFAIQQTSSEIRVTPRSGEPLYFRLQDVTIAGNGGPLGTMIVFHDLTTERQIDKMKTDMINVVVHELRNPLGSIMGFTQILTEDKNLSEAEKVEFLSLIATSSKNLATLVNRFLDISRLESRKVDYPRQPTDLLEVTKTLIDTQRPQLMNKSLRVEFEFQEHLPLAVVSHDLMREAFLNLISNAIKYGDRDRTISITLKEVVDHVVFTITDHGYGIPPEAQRKLFTKFFRVATNPKAVAEVGTGLGLAHVKEIVSYHHGTIALESNPEIGCKFTISIPLGKEA